MEPATLYLLILCASGGPFCPANEEDPKRFTLTRERCLKQLYRANVLMPDYDGYCVQSGGKEIIDHAGRVNDLRHAKKWVSVPAGYIGGGSDPALLERLFPELRE